ncbi:phosphatidylserine decarboxylase [bacterium]|nr:phosphatidylserine decarboxylase [bacterium]
MAAHKTGRFPMDPAGVPFVIPALAVTIFAFAFSWTLVWVLGALITVAMLGFFRDPPRKIPTQPGAVVSPADGLVDSIVINQNPQAGPVGGPCISIFLSVLDVHINRAPCAGRIESTRHVAGQFKNAMDTSSADMNECNWIFMQAGRHQVTVRQIAGLIARRIVCRVQPGQGVKRGERIGLIRFGSRTELYLPAEAIVNVEVGQRVKGGSTVVAWLHE